MDVPSSASGAALAFPVLEEMYGFYDSFVEEFQLACRPGCPLCCTTNIFASSVEAAYLLEKSGDGALRSVDLPDELYRPTTTTNEIARACLEQRLVEDRGSHVKGACPLLGEDGTCTIYRWRPMACRGMHSLSPCTQNTPGADMDPFLMELHLVMYQLIEQLALETGGRCGNLFDLLPSITGSLEQGHLLEPSPFPGLVVMPSNAGRVRAFLRRLLRRIAEACPGLEPAQALVDRVASKTGISL